MRTLLIVSGGDAPGINAALYRFAELAQRHGDEIVGAVGGVAGAVDGHLIDLRPDMLAPVKALGGSFLASSREPVLGNPLNRVRLIETISRQRIDCIIVFGGDGSLQHIPPILQEMGLACVGLPTTIDNDVPGTEETIGFDSACNTAHQVIDGLMATARALPGRVFSVETLGGHTGFLALEIAYTCGADAVIIPEFDYDAQWLADRLKQVAHERRAALLILSEGAAGSRTIVEDMQDKFDLRIRDTRLGHGQRGVSPTFRDRALAVRMVDTAFAALHDNIEVGTVVVQNGQVNLCEMLITNFVPRKPDAQLYAAINGLD